MDFVYGEILSTLSSVNFLPVCSYNVATSPFRLELIKASEAILLGARDRYS